MKKNMTFHKRKIWVVLLCCILMMTGLIGRLVISYVFQIRLYYRKQKNLHEERERSKRPEERFWMQREKFWHQTGRYVQSL